MSKSTCIYYEYCLVVLSQYIYIIWLLTFSIFISLSVRISLLAHSKAKQRPAIIHAPLKLLPVGVILIFLFHISFMGQVTKIGRRQTRSISRGFKWVEI